MPLSSRQVLPVWSFRLILVGMAAVSVGLPIAWISLTKLAVTLFALAYLLAQSVNQRNDEHDRALWTPPVICAIFFAFSVSLVWTHSDLTDATRSLVKHSKLMQILLLILLIRTPREARIGVMAFAVGQGFLLLSSWLLVAGLPVPWRTAWGRGSEYVVFSSYLDQSIIFATTAAVFWQLRADKLWPVWLGSTFAVAALANSLLVLESRTGYAVAITLFALAAMWKATRHFRLLTLIAAPLVMLSILYFGSTQVQNGLSKLIHESQSYVLQNDIGSASGWNGDSSGWRLNAWHRSVQAIEQSPWLGHGIGSWTETVKRLEGKTATTIFGDAQVSNPHQEYLLWGVELGAGGILLLLLLMIAIVRDSQSFSPSNARATQSVVAAMAIACLFNSALYDGLIGDFFCVALGLLMALGLRSTAAKPGAGAPARLGVCAKVAV